MLPTKISDNVYQFCFVNFGSCVYLIKLKDKNILIDTSSKENSKDLLGELEYLGIKKEDIDIILITHSHFDHIGNINLFANAKVFDYNNISKFPIKEIKIIKTPGHTQDSVCYLYKDILFSGDTIFHNGWVGRVDFPESDPYKMKESLEKISKIKYKTLCPGHI